MPTQPVCARIPVHVPEGRVARGDPQVSLSVWQLRGGNHHLPKVPFHNIGVGPDIRQGRIILSAGYPASDKKKQIGPTLF